MNKAYNVLKQEGFINLDKRRGAVIALDADKLKGVGGECVGTASDHSCKRIASKEYYQRGSVRTGGRDLEEYGALV